MSVYKELGEQLAINTNKVLYEFEFGNLLGAASLSLGKNLNSPHIEKIHTYDSVLNDAITNLTSLTLNIPAGKINEYLVRAKLHPIESKGLDTTSSIGIYPEYIKEYMKLLDQRLEAMVHGNRNAIIEDVINTSKYKDKIVRSNITDSRSPIKLIARIMASDKRETIDVQYLRTVVIPFCRMYDTKKESLLSETKNLLDVIKLAEDGINNVRAETKSIRVSDNVDKAYKKKIIISAYEAVRSLIDVISYATSMMLKKIDLFNSNVTACNTIFMKLSNTEKDSRVDTYTKAIKESGTDTVLDLSTGNIAQDFIHGQVGAFEDFANRIFELHAGLPRNFDSDKSIDYRLLDTRGEYMGGYAKYDRTPYDEGYRTFSMIFNALDGMYDDHSDSDELSRYDFINDNGFTAPLEQMFSRALSEIQDLSKYNIPYNDTNSFDMSKYQSLLAEVKDYPKNVKKVADEAQHAKEIINDFINKFDNNVNNEYRKVANINELIDWLNDFRKEFNTFSIKMAQAYMIRLRKIADTLLKMVNMPSNVNKIPSADIDDIDNVDLNEYTYDCEAEMDEILETAALREVEMAYYREKEFMSKGKFIMFEADNAPNTNNNPNNNNSTKPTVTDNSGANSVGSTNIKSIIDKAQEWFSNVVEKFKNIMTKILNHKNAKTIIENANYLKTRSYNNVTINILPYDLIDPKELLDDVGKCTVALNGLNAQNLASINTKEDLYPKVFSFIDKEIPKSSDKPLPEMLKNYYKTKSFDVVETKEISNGDLKTYVVNTMLPFITEYQSTYSNELNKKTDELRKALNSLLTRLDTVGVGSASPNDNNANNQQQAKVVSFPSQNNGAANNTNANTTTTSEPIPVAASAYVNPITGFLFTEEEVNNQNNNNQNNQNNNNKNTQQSLGEKGKWITGLTQTFIGCVCNAIRDREKDYIGVMYQLCPKDKNQQQTQQPQQNQ